MKSAILFERPPSLALSVVVPVKNEVDNVPSLAAEITDTLSRTAWTWECIWVDDGSTDATAAAVTALHQADERHRVVLLEHNHGQSAALAAGIVRSRGRLVATIDGDGQNDPADLPRLVALLEEHDADVVNGVRARRRSTRLRRLSSRIANAFRNRLTGETVRDVGCSLRVMRRETLEGVFVFRGMHRFLPTLVRINGYDAFLEVEVNDRPRRYGTTKYGIWDRLWVGIADTLMVRRMLARSVRPRVRTATAPREADAFAARRHDTTDVGSSHREVSH